MSRIISKFGKKHAVSRQGARHKIYNSNKSKSIKCTFCIYHRAGEKIGVLLPFSDAAPTAKKKPFERIERLLFHRYCPGNRPITSVLLVVTKQKCTDVVGAFLLGDPYGNRTHVTAVKGRCLSRLTNGPGSGGWIRTHDRPGMNRLL